MKRQVSNLVEESAGVGGLPLKTLNLEMVERGLDLQSEPTGFVECSVVGKAMANVVKVQQPHG